MSKSSPQFEKVMKETANFGTQYSDACAKSGAIWMKGVEEIMTAVSSMTQSSAEKYAEFAKEAMGSKTITEFAEVQKKIAQASFDDFMSGATKISEISAKVLTESTEPVSTQMNEALQKATKSMAA